eukprot:scaffold120382_cov16-Prasinocladus_malaysianus.AAC.1
MRLLELPLVPRLLPISLTGVVALQRGLDAAGPTLRKSIFSEVQRRCFQLLTNLAQRSTTNASCLEALNIQPRLRRTVANEHVCNFAIKLVRRYRLISRVNLASRALKKLLSLKGESEVDDSLSYFCQITQFWNKEKFIVNLKIELVGNIHKCPDKRPLVLGPRNGHHTLLTLDSLGRGELRSNTIAVS